MLAEVIALLNTAQVYHRQDLTCWQQNFYRTKHNSSCQEPGSLLSAEAVISKLITATMKPTAMTYPGGWYIGFTKSASKGLANRV